MSRRPYISSFSMILVFICLSLLGATLIPLLAVKVSPTQTLPQLSVGFSMQGSSPRTVEMEATSKLEAMLSRMNGIQQIRSTSGNGWGRIHISFDKHTDMETARFEVSTIIRQVRTTLPENVSYPTISQSYAEQQADRPFLTFTINAPVSPQDILQFTENNLKPPLSMIEGVDKVDVSGATPMIWKLNYDAHLMRRYGVEIGDIQQALTNALREGFLDMAHAVSIDARDEWLRVTLQPILSTEDNPFAGIGVKSLEGTLIPLEKLTRISREEAEPQSYFRVNGLNSIYLSLTAGTNSNQLALRREVGGLMDDLTEALPPGYEVHLNYDATEYIKMELNKVYFRSSLTMFVLLLFVLLSYRRLRYIVLIVVSLCCNLAIAVLGYYFLRLEIQLYSLVGITISLTLILDNTIVMADHLIRKRNRKSFMAILAATLTTIGALSVIFFLEERLRLSLQDFAAVIMVNLGVSLAVALFLVPALIDKLKLSPARRQCKPRRVGRQFARKRRLYTWFVRPYSVLCRSMYRWRVVVVSGLILAFGLPVFMLPEKLEGESRWVAYYNNTLGTPYYKDRIAPIVNNVLGGTLRIFVQKVYTGSYFVDQAETTLNVNASLPSHATMAEMNGLIKQMESYLSQFREIKQFQTNIYSSRRANIEIRFTAEHAQGGFPYVLRSNLISKSLELGGGSWSVYGLGDGFSNDVRESAGSYRVEMFGFNYDDLFLWVKKFEEQLLENRRIREVNILSEFSWFKDDYEEFLFSLNNRKLAEEDIQPYELYHQLELFFGRNINAGDLDTPEGKEAIVLGSVQGETYDIWQLLNSPVQVRNREYKLSELAEIARVALPQEVGKVDQQYRICLQYEYIGAAEQGRKVLERAIESFEKRLPTGYSIKNSDVQYRWDDGNEQQYILLLLLFVIIYFVSAILFNSLRQPFCILFVVPISFIGIFLSFYLFKINFDQGGFASFILLSGLTINANIYVINEYNNIRKAWPKLPPLRAYLQAWNAKVRPIVLTVLSTILGFVPFLIGDTKEGFWFPLAVGTIGGLVVSTCATFLFLPLFMGVGKKRKN